MFALSVIHEHGHGLFFILLAHNTHGGVVDDARRSYILLHHDYCRWAWIAYASGMAPLPSQPWVFQMPRVRSTS